MGEVTSIFIKKAGNHVSIGAGAESANVELIELANVFEKFLGVRPQPCVVPRGIWAMQLKMKHIL